MSKEYKYLDCIEIKQPIGSFYIAKIDVVDLLKISFADIRRIEKETDNIWGIQRELSPKRVKDLSKYVQYKDATFPTSIILSINSDKLVNTGDPEQLNSEEEIQIVYEDGRLKVLIDKEVAKIIDGYHRIAGLESREGEWEYGEFELNVTIFIDMDPEDEAIVFSTINKQQTKPSNSLAYDLFELAKTRSPQKTSHNIARLFNKELTNPFYRKIKLLGKSIYGTETISQATFVDALMAHISSDPMMDRDILKRNEKEIKLLSKEIEKHIFRKLFVEGKDVIIAKNLSNYFTAVREKWQVAWENRAPDFILNRTTGFIALMKFLKHAYSSSQKDSNDIVSIEIFKTIFDEISIQTEDLTKNVYKPGGSGIAHLYRDLKAGTKSD